MPLIKEENIPIVLPLIGIAIGIYVILWYLYLQ